MSSSQSSRVVDQATGEVQNADERMFRARLKGIGAVKPDSEGFVSVDVTFTMSGHREGIQDLIGPIHELMARTESSDVLEVVVTPVVKQRKLWG